MTTDDLEPRPTRIPLSRRPLSKGRVGAYTTLGAATRLVPLPFVPDALIKRVRGALAHDLATRYGLALAPEAREVLASPSAEALPKGFVAAGVRFALGRVLGRVGPLALLLPVRAAVDTFLLGHLLERYLETARTTRSVRVDLDEARRVRRAMDQAILYAITTEGTPLALPEEPPVEDLRDAATRVTDGVLQRLAGTPGWLLARVEAAFDDVLLAARP